MKKPGPEHVEALRQLVAKVPLAKRREVADSIQCLQDLMGIKENLVADRRSTMWGKDGLARQSVADRKAYQVQWRGCDPVMCNIEEAAKEARKKVSSLRTYLAKGNGRWDFNIEDEILTIKKINE